MPARGGSKSIKNKNIVKVNNKPLIHYTLENAINSKYLDRVIVSTDSKKIKNICNKYDVPFLRPKKFALDNSLTSEAIFHAINYLSKNNVFFYDYMNNVLSGICSSNLLFCVLNKMFNIFWLVKSDIKVLIPYKFYFLLLKLLIKNYFS